MVFPRKAAEDNAGSGRTAASCAERRGQSRGRAGRECAPESCSAFYVRLIHLNCEISMQDSALKPRLVTSLQAHTDTVSRYTESKTLLDLLSSLRSAQTAVSLVKTCLDECQLDEAVRALLSVGRVLNNDIEDWKRDNEHYTHIQAGLVPFRCRDNTGVTISFRTERLQTSSQSTL